MINWIDIKIKKPTKNIDYLIYRQFDRPHIKNKTVSVARYFPDYDYFNLDPILDGVTHWAEIPNTPDKPYQEPYNPLLNIDFKKAEELNLYNNRLGEIIGKLPDL